MEDASPSPSDQPRSRGRGRGKSRGGLGKYLRARGRGHAYGRPAEFTPRQLLEGEGPGEIDDPEETAAIQQRYAKRTLASNADRYTEEAPQLDSDGEEVHAPEVDLSSFLARQRRSEPDPPQDVEEEEIDDELAHITSRREPATRSKKGRVQTIAWDDALEEMRREKAVAEANRDLKERFRARTSTLRAKPMAPNERRKENDIVEAPPLPIEAVANKDPKGEMQDFLDGLLE